jgi:para-aminobenzoate synthetase component 1
MVDATLHIEQLISELKKIDDIIVLESQKKDHPSSQRSYVAAFPRKKLFGKGRQVFIKNESKIVQIDKSPWDAIKEFQAMEKDWMFGYLGYDLKNDIEDLASENYEHYKLPDFYFMIPELLIEFDYLGRYKILKGKLTDLGHKFSIKKKSDICLSERASFTKDKYEKNVIEAKELIHKGEIYEINYSYMKEFDFDGTGWDLYQAMKLVGPVPFGGFVKIDDIEVCCASPERFLKREGGVIISQPIKGTISNTANSSLEVLKNDKNRAENLMIVDLVRNDLNRIAISGSVKVKNLFEVQTFDTVHQLVSTVMCKVQNDKNSVEIIKACFPMGSMTGAPKIAAMKAIEKLEDYKRGIYSGALGYIKPNGDFDFNVVIRTAIIDNEVLFYPVGGAITSDSNSEDEWEETLIKTEALKKALK